MPVLVILEIIPLNAKLVIRNHPKRYTLFIPTCPAGTVHGSLTFLIFVSHIIYGMCMGEIAAIAPKIVGNTNIHSINEGII